ncbi:hypothetical protein ES708_14690 [subsurface metagenome]
MKIILIPILQKGWNSKEMEIVRRQARVSARRIRKGIDVRLERTRFTSACNRIEELAFKNNSDSVIEIEGENINRLLNTLPKDGDSQPPFIEPEDVSKVFKYIGSQNLKKNLQPSGGVVILVEAFNGKPNLFISQTKSIKSILNASTPDYSVCEVDIETLREEEKRFHEQIRNSIETGIPLGWVNIGGEGKTGLVRHEALIASIREYIYLKEQPKKIEMVQVIKPVPDEEATEKRNSKWYYKLFPFLKPHKPVMKQIKVKEPKVIALPITPINVQFAYEDGTIGGNFPLFGLLKDTEPVGLPTIKAALISNRHFEVDSEVDFCLIRNSEISRREEATMAEQEQLSFEFHPFCNMGMSIIFMFL